METWALVIIVLLLIYVVVSTITFFYLYFELIDLESRVNKFGKELNFVAIRLQKRIDNSERQIKGLDSKIENLHTPKLIRKKGTK